MENKYGLSEDVLEKIMKRNLEEIVEEQGIGKPKLNKAIGLFIFGAINPKLVRNNLRKSGIWYGGLGRDQKKFSMRRPGLEVRWESILRRRMVLHNLTTGLLRMSYIWRLF
jgi:hypothetical protein